MKSISQYISQTLGEEGVIQENEIDICKYGIDYFVISVLEILSVLVFSAFVGNFACTLTYFLAFIPLRIYSGGYHANSKVGCYLILLSVYALFSIVIKHVPEAYFIMVALFSMITTAIIVLSFSPIIHENKSFNEAETKFYRNTSIRIMLIESAIIVVGILAVPHNKLLFSFSLGQLAVSLSMLAAFVKTKMSGGESGEKNKKFS